MSELQEIYFPVTKLPVPPEEVDLIKIKLLDSVFKPDGNGVLKEFRKVYYETSLKGNKVSDGNNYIPSELVALIFNARENVLAMDYAMQSFGFAINHDVFEKSLNVFENPFKNYQSNLENPILIEQNGRNEGGQSNSEPTGSETGTNTTGEINSEPNEPTSSTNTPPAD